MQFSDTAKDMGVNGIIPERHLSIFSADPAGVIGYLRTPSNMTFAFNRVKKRSRKEDLVRVRRLRGTTMLDPLVKRTHNEAFLFHGFSYPRNNKLGDVADSLESTDAEHKTKRKALGQQPYSSNELHLL